MTTPNRWFVELLSEDDLREAFRMTRDAGNNDLEEVISEFKITYGENPDEEARVRRLWKEAQS